MKFEYDKEEDHGEVVAFIHANGALVVKTASGCIVMNGYNGDYQDTRDAFNLWLNNAVKKFYRGDKITITF